MKIHLKYDNTDMLLVYGDSGILSHIIDIETGRKMMVEYTQVGHGYEMTEHNGYIPMEMCNAVYVRIVDIDLFVPKFIFIPNVKT